MMFTAPQKAGLSAGLVAGLGLLAAIVAERWGGVVPCALCLVERWPYRVAILLGLLAFAIPRAARILVALAALTMLASAALGGLHVGVEQGLWPSPLPECAAPQLGSGSMAERLARMPARPAKPCDDPTFLIPGLPLSMAAMNLGLSAILACSLAVSALPRRSVP